MNVNQREDKIVLASLIPCVIFMVLNLVDTVFTGMVVQTFGLKAEGNPLMRWLIQLHPVAFVITKMALAGMVMPIGLDILAKHDPRVINALWFITGVYLAIVAIHISGFVSFILPNL